ncbi:MAG: hypothetical protein GY710_21835 [Desulfobacteraceae bacterium]|nr:hypothetical protein [Desulfobacteraceae bacterium]
MPRVGVVIYKKSDEIGTVTAKWCHLDYGIGIATKQAYLRGQSIRLICVSARNR